MTILQHSSMFIGPTQNREKKTETGLIAVAANSSLVGCSEEIVEEWTLEILVERASELN